jgi:hypothetical protein
MADTDTDGAHKAPSSFMEAQEAYELQRGRCVERPLIVAVNNLAEAGIPFSISATNEAMEGVTGAGTPELLSAIREFLVDMEKLKSPEELAGLAAAFENDKDKFVSAMATAFLRRPEGASAIPPYETGRKRCSERGGHRLKNN